MCDRRNFRPVLPLLLAINIVSLDALDLRLSPPDAGFFVKPQRHAAAAEPLMRRQEQFVLLRPSAPMHVTATLGSATRKQRVPHAQLQPAASDLQANRVLLQPGALSASLVGRRRRHLSSGRIQVLFHASPVASVTPHGADATPTYCATLYVQRGNQEVKSSCVIQVSVDGENSACLAETLLPVHWWRDSIPVEVQLLYSAHVIYSPAEKCSSPRLSVPQATAATNVDDLHVLSTVTLLPSESRDQIIYKDAAFRVRSPKRNVYIGDQFRVTLEPVNASTCVTLNVKAKARKGLVLLNSRIDLAGNLWELVRNTDARFSKQVETELRHRQPFTAEEYSERPLLEYTLYIPEEAGRSKEGLTFNFVIGCKQTGNSSAASVEHRLIVKPTFSTVDPSSTLVPVVKRIELLNTAVISGTVIREPLDVYAVGGSGSILSVRHSSSCHSSDEHVLKVDHGCKWLMLDGSETSGSGNVSLIVKRGQETSYVQLRVWFPVMTLDVSVSDERLAAVRGWNTPKKTGQTHGSGADNARQEGHGHPHRCRHKYQHATFEVYANFKVPDSTNPEKQRYLPSRDGLFRVTHLVMNQVEVDTSIIHRSGNKLVGLRPGKTTLSVRSAEGRKIGGTELRVHGFVTLDSLLVTPLTGLSLHLTAGAQGAGHQTVWVEATAQNRIHSVHQRTELLSTLHFEDGAVTSLSDISPVEYELSVTSLNHSMMVLLRHLSRAQLPVLVPRAPGNGKVWVSLQDTCGPSDALAQRELQIKVEGFGFADTAHTPLNADDWSAGVVLNRQGVKTNTVLATQASELESQTTEAPGDRHSPLEIGLYVLLSVFCCALLIFALNCLVYWLRFKRKRNDKANGLQQPGSATPLMHGGRLAAPLASDMSEHSSEPAMECGNATKEFVWVGAQRPRLAELAPYSCTPVPGSHESSRHGSNPSDSYRRPNGYHPEGYVMVPNRDGFGGKECSSNGYASLPETSRSHSQPPEDYPLYQQPCYSNVEPAPQIPTTRPPPCPVMPAPPSFPPPSRSSSPSSYEPRACTPLVIDQDSRAGSKRQPLPPGCSSDFEQAEYASLPVDTQYRQVAGWVPEASSVGYNHRINYYDPLQNTTA